ncbi:MAG: hypothetical protein ACYDBV_11375 [Nitrospiria bacterium]
MKRTFSFISFSIALGVLISSCSGGGSSSTPAAGVGFSAPTNVSAVPTNQTGLAPKLAGGVGFQTLFALATDPGTDYSNATTTKYVEEHALSQFNIINTILNALEQTHYADTANLGKGPYKAMIAWQDNGEGQQGGQTKKLQPWIVDSSIIVENGKNVNQVLAWIQDEQNGTPMVISAKFKFYASATLKLDGSYQDYGVWTLNALFNNNPNMYFAAAASVGPNGEAIVKFHDFTQGPSGEVKAILNTSNSTGYGKLIFPDYSSCTSWPCNNPTVVTAKYVYDASALGVQTVVNNVASTIQYKDRTAVTDMTHFYGLYDSVTGADVLKTKSFGFPVKYTVNGVDNYAYYGAWQGRHQLWANGGSVPAGTTVTRMDLGPSQPAQAYTVATSFSGTLTKRTLVGSSLNNVLNIPVTVFVNNSFPILWNGTNWCKYPASNTSCGTSPVYMTPSDYSALVADPNNPSQFISISQWGNTPTNYIYDPAGTSGPGFYTATQGPNGNWISTGTKYTPATNDQLYIMIGGSIYIEYTNTSILNPGTAIWVQKSLKSFDKQTWTPTFDDTKDSAYSLTQGQQYYLMNNGTNYVVTMTSPNVYAVSVELQSVANPLNALTFTGTGTVFTPQWSSTGSSSYTFVTDKNDPRYLYLVYNAIGSNDTNKTSSITNQTIQVGDKVTENLYGVVDNNGVQYNWDYAASGGWGTLTYLKDSNGNYKLLDDPISLAAFTLTNVTNTSTLTVAPTYSGWMNGLPDIYGDLKINNWNMSADIISKVYNIPAGTQVTDATNSSQKYLVKPLSVSEFLNPIASYTGTLNITTADSADLTTVPTLVDPAMGTMPNITTVKYSEGKLVQ